jgi:subtilisin family serine protease
MFRFLRIAAGIAVVAGLAMLPFVLSGTEAAGTNVSVIVELKDDPGAVYAAKLRNQGAAVSNDQIQAYEQGLKATQDRFLAQLAASAPLAQVQSVTLSNVNIQIRYAHVYNGIALNVPSSSLATIKAMPQVKDVHPNTRLYTTLDKSVPYINADGRTYGSNNNRFTPNSSLDGNEGQATFVAIIDTGIDWRHAMFGGDPTPPRLGVAPPDTASAHTNQKVVYSLPLADIGVEDGFGHGTHVASTVAGYLANAPGPDGLPLTGDEISIHGVAPQAKLMSYKVCSDIGSTLYSAAGVAVPFIGGCDTSNIVMAIEDASKQFTVTGFAKPKADVINMSLGGGGGPDEPTAVASDNAVLDGVTVIAAAGNSGPGEATLGSPAAGSRVIAVAANTDPGSHYSWAVDALDSNSFPSSQTGAVSPASAFAQQSCIDRIKVFAMAGTPTPPDGAMAQYYALVDDPTVTWPSSVAGRIALVNNSGLASATFADICNQGVNAGAVGLLLNSDVTSPTAVKCSIPAANILPDDAARLVNAMPSHENGALSSFPLRMINDLRLPFVGDTTDFSSRGPVQGYGQVKPDVSAPGANILAAVPPASLLGALEQGEYGAISGTSMATPHVAGVAALIKHAHYNWSPDWIRTALINTATNMRDINGTPKPDGLGTEDINDQGGGLVDVYHAINTKALMGVTGSCAANDTDCIRSTPTILGSHSFGAVPVVNNRITNTIPVTVTIRDISGQGGTYNLNVSNSRDLQQAGIGATLSTTSVNVPANGTATFTVNATIDGNVVRDTTMSESTVTNCTSVNFITHQLQMQWYVTATRSDGGEKLRMPFYLRPVPSAAATSSVSPQSFSGILPAGTSGALTVNGVTRIEHSFEVTSSVYRIDARLDWTGQEALDLDFYLIGPDGNEVTHSAIFGGPEQFTATVHQPGTYKYRVEGYANGPVQYTIAGSLISGPQPPALSPLTGDFANAAGDQIDFDGNVTLRWGHRDGDQGYEIEQSTDYKDEAGNVIPDDEKTWTLIASVNGNTTSYNISGLADGRYFFRAHSLTAGVIGKYVTPGSTATSIVVAARTQVDITSLVQVKIVSGTFGSAPTMNVTLKNNGGETYLPLAEMKVVRISSLSGGVAVTNADNGKSGKDATNAALFDYSRQIGSDEMFSPQEETGQRTLNFTNPAQEQFTFDAAVTAYQGARNGGGVQAAEAGASGSQTSSGTTGGITGLLTSGKAVLRFTYNPLTKSVLVSLVALK